MALIITLLRYKSLNTFILATLFTSSVLAYSAGTASSDTFELHDWLGHNWRNERVHFPISPKLAQRAQTELGLIDETGRPAPFEIISNEREATIEFLADIPKFGSTTYWLALGRKIATSDLEVVDKDGEIRIANSKGGVAIRTQLSSEEGPLVEFKMPSGQWVGASRFTSRDERVTSYTTKIERRGPVAAIVVCQARFSSGVGLELRVTMQPNDPAILIDEVWSAWEHPMMQIALGQNFPSPRVFYRIGSGAQQGQVATASVDEKLNQPIFQLEPWLHWWTAERRGNWFALYDETRADVFAVATLRGDLWIDAADVDQKHNIEPITLSRQRDDLTLDLPGKGKRRKWLIAALPRADAIDTSLVGKQLAPPPQQLVIRHGDFPYDRINDLQLQWHRTDPSHRLLLTKDDLARLRRVARPNPELVYKVETLPLNFFTLVDYFDAYLRTGDKELGWRLSAAAPPAMQAAVDRFLNQSVQLTLGAGPHGQRDILYAVHLADFALADQYLDADTKARLLAQAAFLSDIVHRADYWSPQRGFAANPNMTSIVAGYQGLLACLLHDHPQAPKWLDESLSELEDELIDWSDEKGGWLEAPHYAILSYDHMLGVFACAQNMGHSDYLFNPRMKSIIAWLAQISTPPDLRLSGYRHFPPIGNTFVLEPTGEFGTVAYLWRHKDPRFSAEMQWMHKQSGEMVMPGVGGFWPALAPYQKIFKDKEIVSSKPDYESELFPKTGVVLRTHFGSDRETQLHLIAGSHHAHYDDDSGSITIWGKGRLISDDFGYYGRAPESDHSMIESKAAAATMQIESFSRSRELDAVNGRSGKWTRQIAFIKDQAPLGPNFYVLRDELSGENGIWRLYLSAERVEIKDDRVCVIGHDDVDTDIFFVTGVPSDLKLETITRTSTSSGNNRPQATTQTALVSGLSRDKSAIAIVIYPRLKSEASPRLRSSANGRVIDLETSFGRRLIFLAHERFNYEDKEVRFNGTVGAAIEQQANYILLLGSEGTLGAFGAILSAEAPKRMTLAK